MWSKELRTKWWSWRGIYNKNSQVLTDLSNLELFYKKEKEATKPCYGTEKRRYPRFSVDLPVEYTRKDLVVKQGRVVNASEGGLLVYFPEQMEIGQALRLKLFFPLGSELNMMEIVNQVIWREFHKEEEWGDYRCGVNFIDVSPEDMTKLKKFFKGISG